MDSPGDLRIEGWFPHLKPGEYQVTSPESPEYNCIARAAGDTAAWWEAVRKPGYYWPEEVPWDNRVGSLVGVFESLGFVTCDNATLEPGFEKVAIYGASDEYRHAARQLPGGSWTSKLGVYKDIEHDTLDGLVGDEYGQVVRLMKRPVSMPVTAATGAE